MSGAAIEAIIILAAKYGIPQAMNLIDKILSAGDKGDPTVQELMDLRMKLSIDFDELIGPIPGWNSTTT